MGDQIRKGATVFIYPLDGQGLIAKGSGLLFLVCSIKTWNHIPNREPALLNQQLKMGFKSKIIEDEYFYNIKIEARLWKTLYGFF